MEKWENIFNILDPVEDLPKKNICESTYNVGPNTSDQ